MATYKCNICGTDCEVILSLDKVPSIQNRFCATQQEAFDFPSVAVDFFLCGNCHHISICKTGAAEFDAGYNNDQTASSVALGHLDRVVAQIETEISDRGARIVEIGCGRGELLFRLRERGYRCLAGYDPSAPDTFGGLISRQQWDGASGAADVFILRHTLEEISQVDDFVHQLAAALGSSGALYCEITNAERLVREFDIFSLYPECSNLFSAYSLERLFRRHGLSVATVTGYFEGEWLGVWGHKLAAPPPRIALHELRARLVEHLRRLPQPVALWGIGGRGGNFLSFMAADRALVPIVFDISESKQGLFIPPFGQKISTLDALRAFRPGTILVSNKRYLQEITALAPGCLTMTIDDLMMSEAAQSAPKGYQ
jgi:SAM-dependent methyltransferase